MKPVLFVAAFDSQLKWCAQIHAEFTVRGYPSRVVVPDIRSSLSEQQIADAGFSGVERISWAELLEAALASDIVVCGLSGPATKSLTIDLSQLPPLPGRQHPVVVTGWVGIIIEKITAGYLDRCGADVVAVNSIADLAHFRSVAGKLGLPSANLTLTGLPFLSGEHARQHRLGPIRRVLFADQPTVPAARGERDYLYRQLIAYARCHPDREVLLKPRHRLDEDTFHRMRHHPEELLLGNCAAQQLPD